MKKHMFEKDVAMHNTFKNKMFSIFGVGHFWFNPGDHPGLKNTFIFQLKTVGSNGLQTSKTAEISREFLLFAGDRENSCSGRFGQNVGQPGYHGRVAGHKI